MKVCHAIQHAHQKGIIHRDIKPSNILVTLHDGVPVPKVIDFGIAKAIQQELTEKTIYTQLQQFIGTPAYMSPEQAEMSGLDIDTRSDIYSLGVLLYELLTGMTPFDAKELMRSGLDEMRKIIREREPLRPSSRLTQDCEPARAMIPANRRTLRVPSKLRTPHRSRPRLDRDEVPGEGPHPQIRDGEQSGGGSQTAPERTNRSPPGRHRPPTVSKRRGGGTSWLYTAGVAVFLALAVGLTLAAFGWLQALTQRDAAVLCG